MCFYKNKKKLDIKIEQKVFCKYLLDCLDMWTVEIGIECPCSCQSATLSCSVLHYTLGSKLDPGIS